MTSQVPLLSVCIITYNHESFIERAIKSVLIQEIDFPMEIFIAEDLSPDNTRGIIRKYAEKFPKNIHLILQEKNVGPAINYMDLMTAPKSKYVAYLEGDDFWIVKDKLQQQVDYMEKNPDVSMTFHACDQLTGEKYLSQSEGYSHPSSKLDLSYFLQKGFQIFSGSIVIKKSILQSFPNWFNEIGFGDHTLYLLALKQGKIKYFDEVMGVYRKHPGGATSKRTGLFWANENIKMYTLMKEEFPASTHPLFEQTILRHQLKKANYYLSVKEKSSAWKTIQHIITRYWKFFSLQKFFFLSKMLAKLILK